MAKVYWKVLATGFTGNGSYLDSDIAKAWIKEKSKDNTMKYWIEYQNIKARYIQLKKFSSKKIVK